MPVGRCVSDAPRITLKSQGVRVGSGTDGCSESCYFGTRFGARNVAPGFSNKTLTRSDGFTPSGRV